MHVSPIYCHGICRSSSIFTIYTSDCGALARSGNGCQMPKIKWRWRFCEDDKEWNSCGSFVTSNRIGLPFSDDNIVVVVGDGNNNVAVPPISGRCFPSASVCQCSPLCGPYAYGIHSSLRVRCEQFEHNFVSRDDACWGRAHTLYTLLQNLSPSNLFKYKLMKTYVTTAAFWITTQSPLQSDYSAVRYLHLFMHLSLHTPCTHTYLALMMSYFVNILYLLLWMKFSAIEHPSATHTHTTHTHPCNVTQRFTVSQSILGLKLFWLMVNFSVE